MATSDSVPGAIRILFNANGAALAAIPGNLWANEIPEDVDLANGPAVVLEMEEEFEFTFERSYIERDNVHLTVYGITAATVEAAVLALRAALFWQPLPLNVATPVAIEPRTGAITSDQVRWRTGEIIWHWRTDLNVELVRTY